MEQQDDGKVVESAPADSSTVQATGEVFSSKTATPFQTEQGNVSTSAQDEVNELFLTSLIEFGFDDLIARIALKRTANAGIEQAVQWIIERSNESDFGGESEESSSEEEDEMGGTQSVISEGLNMSSDALKALAKSARTHKMIFVVNMSLKMGTGKVAAQVAHACLGVYQSAMGNDETRAGIESWQRRGAVKVVVRGESTEQLLDLFKQAKDSGCCSYLVCDAGYTQIPAGSRTVLGVFGPVEAVNSVTGGLKLL